MPRAVDSCLVEAARLRRSGAEWDAAFEEAGVEDTSLARKSVYRIIREAKAEAKAEAARAEAKAKAEEALLTGEENILFWPLTLEETRGNITIRLLSQSYEVIRDIWYKRISTERPPQELSASTVLSLLAGTEEESCVTFASRRNATEVKTALTLTGEVRSMIGKLSC